MLCVLCLSPPHPSSPSPPFFLLQEVPPLSWVWPSRQRRSCAAALAAHPTRSWLSTLCPLSMRAPSPVQRPRSSVHSFPAGDMLRVPAVHALNPAMLEQSMCSQRNNPPSLRRPPAVRCPALPHPPLSLPCSLVTGPCQPLAGDTRRLAQVLAAGASLYPPSCKGGEGGEDGSEDGSSSWTTASRSGSAASGGGPEGRRRPAGPAGGSDSQEGGYASAGSEGEAGGPPWAGALPGAAQAARAGAAAAARAAAAETAWTWVTRGMGTARRCTSPPFSCSPPASRRVDGVGGGPVA